VVILVRLAEADPASDALVVTNFKAGITNSDVLGWTAADPCSWSGPGDQPGVTCDGAGNVVQLRVRDYSLKGTVTPDLNKLASLTYLELVGNNLTGPMPSLAGMSKLTTANLGNNDFTSIPADFFVGLTSIEGLFINDNPNLNASSGGWTLPASMTDAAGTLTTFYMNTVGATGSIPSYFGTMTALKTLRMGFNSLSGPVPDSFATSGLRELRLNNQVGGGFTGGISFIGTMTSLTLLYLHANSFTGPVPEGITNSVGLTDLRLSGNQLVGRLPRQLGNLRSLQTLWLGDGNKFSGELPVLPAGSDADTTTFCAGPGIACSTNVNALLDFLEGVGYPQAIATTWIGGDPCTTWTGVACNAATGDVTSLLLSKSSLTGSISPSLANLTSLETLTLSSNGLTGVIPSELTFITTLKTVDVSNNNLSPPLPVFPASVTFIYSGNALLDGTATPPAATPPVATPPAATPPAATPPAGTPPTLPPAITPSPIAPVSAPPPGTVVSPVPSSIAPNSSPPGIIDPPASSPTSKKSSILPAAVGGAVGGGALLMLLFVFFCCYKQRAARKSTIIKSNREAPSRSTTGAAPDLVNIILHNSGSSHGAHNLDSQQGSESWNMTFTIDELRSVTNNFAEHNVLGRGGFGVVYKGVMPDGTKIAVKRMEAAVVSSKGLKEFQSEIEVLTKVKHRHLVGLLGYCTDGIERLLVYEYMSQGTLAQHLFKYEEMQVKPLSWTQRLTIALDVGQAVEYLHGLAHRSFIHRDLKPSNVLLNDDFRAKVSDFGLVKLAPEGTLHSVETRLAGTFGYLAPEYAVTGRVTTKADVFSFGVVLMELITGRRAVDETQREEDIYLVTWFTRQIAGRSEDQLRAVIDPNIRNSLDEDYDGSTFKSIMAVAELAGHCTAREPSQRPDMGHAVSVLRPLVDEWKPTTQDFQKDYNSSSAHDMSLSKVLKQWQEFHDESASAVTDASTASLPTRPGGFADSFTSADGR